MALISVDVRMALCNSSQTCIAIPLGNDEGFWWH